MQNVTKVTAEEILKRRSQMSDGSGFKKSGDVNNFYNSRVCLLESKAVSGMPTLAEANVQNESWLEVFEQIISELRPKLSPIIEFVRTKKPDKATREVFDEEFKHLEQNDLDVLWEKANADLWTILYRRTSGTAKLKLKSAEGTTPSVRKSWH